MTTLSVQTENLLRRCTEAHDAYQQDRVPRDLPHWQRTVHHQSYLLGRILDVRTILERLGGADVAQVNLAYEADRRWPNRGTYKTFPSDYQEHMNAEHRLTMQMQLDLESLLIFGNLVLDQVAMFYKLRHQLPGGLSKWRFPFHELCRQIDNSENDDPNLVALRQAAAPDAWWLWLNVRGFRNTFVEHPERAWQRGTTRMVYGEGFTFFIPATVGSLTEEETAAEFQRLDQVWVPEDVRQLVPLGRRRLDWLVHNIDAVTRREEREVVAAVWRILGGESADYRDIGRRLVGFMQKVSALQPGS